MIYSAVVSFALGILSEKFFHLDWSSALFVVLVSLSVFAVLRSEKGKTIFLCSLFLAVGILRMSFVDTSPDPNFLKFVGEGISFEAVITDEPDVRDTSTRYVVSINQDSRSLILLVANRFPELEYGDKISVSGKLQLPKNFRNENGTEFDYVSYLSKDKIHFLIYYPEIEKTGKGEGNKIVSFLYSLKDVFVDKISDVVPEPNSSLLAGVIFGAKQSLGQDLLDDFKKVGLVHIVVLSGYNITIIAAGIFYSTSFLGKRNLGFAVSVIAIILFSIMVGLGATVIRAGIMALIAILARLLGRPTDALRWLFIAGFLMLLWNPLSLVFGPSFQLSFMATLGLILFSPFVYNFISQKIPFITVRWGIREIISSTLAVQIFILPLLIGMSGSVSLISFIVNPLVLPLVPWAMGLGALTGAIGILPFIGGIFSWPFGIISYFITQIIIVITEFSASISFVAFSFSSLPLWLIFIWYSLYAFLFLKLRSKKYCL